MNIYQILEALKGVEETCDTGTTFVGKMAGTDPASARYSKLVGEVNAPATLADKLRAQWEETKAQKGLTEYGMTTGGTVAPDANSQPDPQAQAKQAATLQQNVNKLKSAGMNIPNVGQAVQSISKDPATDPATSQDHAIAGGLGQEVEQLAKGDPSMVNQLAQLIQKSKQQQGQ